MYAVQPSVELFKMELLDWGRFLGWTMLLELISALANDVFFVLIDWIVGNRAWHLVYAMLCADGPLGFFLWVLLSQSVSFCCLRLLLQKLAERALNCQCFFVTGAFAAARRRDSCPEHP